MSDDLMEMVSALDAPGAGLYWSKDGGDPFVAALGTGDITWQGNRLYLTNALKVGYIEHVGKVNRHDKYRLTSKGHALIDPKQVEIDALKGEVDRLREEIAILRSAEQQEYLAGLFHDLETYTPLHDKLTQQERAFYTILSSNKGRIVPRDAIVEVACGEETSEKTVDVVMMKVRRKLAKLVPEVEIRTVHGQGFVLADREDV